MKKSRNDYQNAKADPDRNILWSRILRRKTSGVVSFASQLFTNECVNF